MNAIILQAHSGAPLPIIILILVIMVIVLFIKNKKLNAIIKTALIPKKLWVLRFYERLLTFIVELTLVSYILVSIYNLIKNDNFLGDLILGYAGFYVVSVCLAILFVTQVVSLFLNIHDNIEDVRNKNIDPNFSIDIVADKENKQESSVRTLITIISIVLAIILSFVNLNRRNSNLVGSSQQETPIQLHENNLNENKQDFNLALDNIFDQYWGFINQFKSTANIKASQLNEVCDDSYCVSFTQIENLLIVSYSSKKTLQSGTKIYDLNNNNIVLDNLESKFYVGKLMDHDSKILYIYDPTMGYNDNIGRWYRDGTLDLKTLSVNWEDIHRTP